MVTNAWAAPVSGDWGDATKWSLGHVPTASEDAVITVVGNYSVTHNKPDADKVKSLVSNRPFDISAGSLEVETTVQVNNSFTLTSGSLIGAKILTGTGGQGLVSTGLSGVIEGVTLDADLFIPDGTSVVVRDNLVLMNNHTITLTSDGLGTDLIFENNGQPQSLSGTGTIVLDGILPGGNRIDIADNTSPDSAMTIESGITIQAKGGRIFPGNYEGLALINKGVIVVDDSSGMLTIENGGTFRNQGSITAEAGATLSILGTWENQGSVVNDNSTLELGGHFTDTGSITRVGDATTYLTGTIDKAGATLAIGPSTGTWLIKGGTVKDARIQFFGGYELFLGAGDLGTIDGCILDGDWTLGDGSSLNIVNGLTFANNHAFFLSGGEFGAGLAAVNNGTPQTIGGTGRIVFASTDPRNSLYLDDTFFPNGTLTVGENVTIAGPGNGAVDSGLFQQSKMIFKGKIVSSGAGRTISITGAGVFDNQGTLEASTGTIAITKPYNNANGTMVVGVGGLTAGNTAGQITVAGQFTAGGTLRAKLANGFVPNTGDVVTAIKYTSRTGNFATTQLTPTTGISFTQAAGASSTTLTATRTGGAITGMVFNDPNSNGVKNDGEPPIANWTVYLDTDNDNTLDAGEKFTTTDDTGYYWLSGLADGTYNVKQVLQSGYRKTNPGSGVPGYMVGITGQMPATDAVFGDTTNIYLGGHVFNDANNNGVQDAGESGIAGVTVNINSNNTTVATRVTDANGFWQVKGLSAGTGEAVAVLPAGYTFGSPAGGKYTGSMTSGQQNGNLNFGLKKTSLAAPAPLTAGILAAADIDALIEELV